MGVYTKFSLAVLCLGCFQGCGDTANTTVDAGTVFDSGATDGVSTGSPINITFERIKNSNNGQSFKVIIEKNEISPEFITSTNLSKGSIGDWTQAQDNRIEAVVTPEVLTPTGQYELVIQTQDGESFRRVPVIVDGVNDRWNQPELFLGPVNTIGWEDSPQVFVKHELDGTETLYLSLVYIPLSFECVHDAAGDLKDPRCQSVVGPYQAPERPHMTISSFVDANGTIDHSLPNLLGLNFGIAPKLGATMFVFEIGNDNYPGFIGTPETTPQALIFENDDGFSVNSGPFLFEEEGEYFLMYHNDRFIDAPSLGCPGYPEDTQTDIYILDNYDFESSKIVLGTYNRVDPGQLFSDNSENTGTLPCPELLLQNHLEHGLPTSGVQDNPTVYFPTSPNEPMAIWDREGTQQGDLKASILDSGQAFPNGTWSDVVGLSVLQPPPRIGMSQPEKTQPNLSSDEFCYRVEERIECRPYNGEAPSSSSAYGAAEIQMQGVGFTGTPYEGQISVVGEPTIFVYQQTKCMSFIVAGKIGTEQDANLNLDIGWVCQ